MTGPDPMEHDDNAWSSRAKVAFGVFAIIAAFFVVAEHRAHLLPYLPLLLLAACPLMHVFMHHGHGGHRGHHGRDGRNVLDGDAEAPTSEPERSREGNAVPRQDGRQPHGQKR